VARPGKAGMSGKTTLSPWPFPPCLPFRACPPRALPPPARGPGHSADRAPLLFDPCCTTRAVGVGMGLCRAKRVMAALDGEIRVENHPEGGVVAILSVPGGPPSGEPPDLEHSRDTGS